MLALAIAVFAFDEIQLNLTLFQGMLFGVVLCTTFLLLILLRNKYASNDQLTDKNLNSSNINLNSHVWMGIFIGIVLLGIIGAILIYNQIEIRKAHVQREASHIRLEKEKNESIRISSLMPLMAIVLDKVDEELSARADKSLTQETINRIADLSNALVPYSYSEKDSLKGYTMSPERGQLLLALAKLDMDSISFQKIKAQTTFSGADLRGADLVGVDLSGVDLSFSVLNGADFTGANLQNCNLKYATFRATILNEVDLRGANLNRANAQWAEINKAKFSKAFLNGIDFSYAKLRESDLSNIKFRFGSLKGAFLNYADLSNSDLTGTACEATVLINANLQGSNLKMVNLRDANLKDAKLENAKVVMENWFETLHENHVLGAAEIENTYVISQDTSDNRFYRINSSEKSNN